MVCTLRKRRDNTMDLTGEMEDRNFIITRGDSRIAVTIARNQQTVKFGRTYRFLIDDPDSPLKLAYTLSKPLKLGWSFNEQGVYKFVLQEVQTTSDDNQSLGIADYYKHFPRTEAETDTSIYDVADDEPNTSTDTGTSKGKEVWL